MKNVKKLEETIQGVATNTRKQENKEWFDKECAKVKVTEKKNTTRDRAIQIKTRGAKNTN
jgi:hypothetical protein